ncbi:MAG: DUF3750 domain-containing protein [Ectothiorhodospiraceae bacterium]|nr:DUF3750 domain-containing protein [Ectothiorhodospiraceae bacterium]
MLLLLALLLAGPVIVVMTGEARVGDTWYGSDRSSAGLAPDAETHPEAVVQIYSARAFGWRGAFAVHTWVATKDAGAHSYRIHEVTRWRGLASYHASPDRTWFGSMPTLHADLRGDEAEAVLHHLEQALERYPHARDYEAWPGPNSNTFTAWLIREIPGLQVELPSTAIGKDYLSGRYLAPVPSGSGYQFSIHGVAGVAAARREGLEFNILGLVLGVDPLRPAVKVPGLGRLGRQ